MKIHLKGSEYKVTINPRPLNRISVLKFGHLQLPMNYSLVDGPLPEDNIKNLSSLSVGSETKLC